MSFCRLSINHAALRANYATLQRRASPARVAATLKADAYGLGVDPIAQTLSQAGCRDFFVATPFEGVAVRRVVPEDARIFVFAGVQNDSIVTMIQHRLTPVLNSEHQCLLWQQASRDASRRLPAFLHIDTGMMRLGLHFGTETWAQSMAAWQAKFHDTIELQGVMSHLACASSSGDPFNEVQRQRFAQVQESFPGVTACFGNSAGLHLSPRFFFDMVRPGIALYGVRTDPQVNDPALVLALQLQAQILHLKTVQSGESIGYGQTFVAKRPLRIAVLGMGYADGFPRRLSNRARVWLGNVAAPVVGRVSMDMVTVDVSLVPDPVSEGDWVTIFSTCDHISELARLATTVEHDILTGLGARVERVHRHTAAE